MRTLTTPRLCLRPFAFGDAADLFDYAKDPQVGPRAGWPVHESLQDSQEIAEKFAADDEVLAITLAGEGRVIGSVGLHRRQPDVAAKTLRCRELGYVLHPAYWGRGFVPEAARACIACGFEEMNLQRIYCGYYDGNDQSRRVMEKCGFTYLFDRRSFLERLGETRLEHFYKLDREDWRP